jgi:F-type H+-transporting ATPase subunit epsilon
MATLVLKIVTPEAVTFSDEVDSVVVPAADGEMGILPHHVPVMAQLKPGELRYRKGAEERFLALGRGFVEILPESVSVLTESAFYNEDIDEAETEAAVKRARESLAGTITDADEQAAIEAEVLKLQAMLEVKKRRR